MAAILDFRSEQFWLFLIYKSPRCFLPSFVDWPLISGEEGKNRFSRWRPSWISDRNEFSFFWSAKKKKKKKKGKRKVQGVPQSQIAALPKPQEEEETDNFWLCWGLTTRQPLRVILCRLPEKGRKEIEERVEEMKERDREERGTGMKVKKQKK